MSDDTAARLAARTRDLMREIDDYLAELDTRQPRTCTCAMGTLCPRHVYPAVVTGPPAS